MSKSNKILYGFYWFFLIIGILGVVDVLSGIVFESLPADIGIIGIGIAYTFDLENNPLLAQILFVVYHIMRLSIFLIAIAFVFKKEADKDRKNITQKVEPIKKTDKISEIKVSKSQKISKIIIGLIVSLFCLGMLYILFSNNYPGSKWSIQGIKDRNSHFYQVSVPFNYGDYQFTISPTTKALGKKQNCQKVASKTDFCWVKAPDTIIGEDIAQVEGSRKECYEQALTDCQYHNWEIDESQLLDVQVSIRNSSKRIQNPSKNWFKIEVDNDLLDNNDGVEFYLKNSIGPNETTSNAFNTRILKTVKEVRIIVTLPGKASQIVKLAL